MARTNTPIDIETIFHALQEPCIVVAADDNLTVIEENPAHARLGMVRREEVIGRPLLEAFPDTSKEYKLTGKSQLESSIRRVIRTGQPDTMPRLRYDLRDKNGLYTSKYWNVTHHPIKDEMGHVRAVYQETKDITDELAVGAELTQTRQQLDQVLSSSLIGTWQWNLQSDVVTTDANLARMFGIDPDKARLGLPLKSFIRSIYSKDRVRVQQSIDQAIRQQSAFEEEYRTVSGDGELRWVIARGAVESDAENDTATFSGIIIDITDRKRAEQALADSETSLRFMADTLPQLVWVAGPNGYPEYYNQPWYDFTGTSPGETDIGSWNELFHPDDREKALKVWHECLQTGSPCEMEYRLFHAPSATHRWVIGRALPFRDETGKILKWYGTCTDIHEHKHSAEIAKFLADMSKQLSRSLDYKKMLKNVTKLCVPVVADWCSIELYDPETGFEQVSVAHTDPGKILQAAEYRKHNPVHIDDPTGLPLVIRTGKSEYYPLITDDLLEQYIEPGERLDFMKSLQLRSIIIAPLRIKEEVVGGISFILSESGRSYTSSDLEMVEELAARISLTLTNTRLYADAQADLKRRTELEKELRQEKQKLESRVKERTRQLQETNEGLRREIQKRHAAEVELQAYSKDLARSDAELEDFAYVASHDLQEPLRKIQAFSNLLLNEYGPTLGDGSDYINRMHAAALRMSTLIQDLLSFSRVATKPSQPTSVDLNETVKDVLYDLDTRIEEVAGTVQADDLPIVRADPTHMRQLFQNLIANGLKFHKPDVPPVVTISAQAIGETEVELRFADNGIGFDEKYLDKIFSVFQRLHGRDAYEGTGIGLAVCRKIVEQYGGTITAESSKHNGATFIVRLPKSKEKL